MEDSERMLQWLWALLSADAPDKDTGRQAYHEGNTREKWENSHENQSFCQLIVEPPAEFFALPLCIGQLAAVAAACCHGSHGKLGRA